MSDILNIYNEYNSILSELDNADCIIWNIDVSDCLTEEDLVRIKRIRSEILSLCASLAERRNELETKITKMLEEKQ